MAKSAVDATAAPGESTLRSRARNGRGTGENVTEVENLSEKEKKIAFFARQFFWLHFKAEECLMLIDYFWSSETTARINRRSFVNNARSSPRDANARTRHTSHRWHYTPVWILIRRHSGFNRVTSRWFRVTTMQIRRRVVVLIGPARRGLSLTRR